MAAIGEQDYRVLRNVPCHALGSVSLSKLSSCLQVEHVLPGKNGYWRDWRVLADLVFSYERLDQLRGNPNAVEETLKAWPREATIGQIITALEAVERFDVIDDCFDSLLDDCREFETRREVWGEPSFLHSSKFRAFVIHAIENTEFVIKIINEIESKDVRLFIPARDFPSATSGYLQKLHQIMEHRCDKIIIVISQALSKDQDLMSLVEKAEEIRAMESGMTKSKVVPVIIENCPRVGFSLSTISAVNFRSRQDWAWRQLKRTLADSSDPSNNMA